MPVQLWQIGPSLYWKGGFYGMVLAGSADPIFPVSDKADYGQTVATGAAATFPSAIPNPRVACALPGRGGMVHAAGTEALAT